MTRLGIIIGGGLAFALLAAACIVQQADEVARPPVVRLPAALSPGARTLDAQPLPEPMLRAEFSATALVLTGRVPDAAARDAIVERAQRIYGQAQVRDRLTITPVTRPAWLNATFPPDLRETRLATALLQDGRLLVIGETGSDAARARVDSALAPFATQGLHLDVRLDAGVVESAQANAPPGQKRFADPGGSTMTSAGR